MNNLSRMHCVPCSGDEPVVTDDELAELKKSVPEWQVIEKDGVRRLRREFIFDNFSDALDFTDDVGDAAEEEGHHPILVTEWGKVTVTWWTHKIGGLHKNDFVMAAKSDELYEDE